MQGDCCDYAMSMKQVELDEVHWQLVLLEHIHPPFNELLSPNISTLCNTSKSRSSSLIAKSFDIITPLVKVHYKGVTASEILASFAAMHHEDTYKKRHLAEPI